MHEIQPNLLWIGHAFDIREPQQLFEAGIKAIIDIAYEEPITNIPRQLVYCRFPLNDGGGNDPALLRQAVQVAVDLLRAGTPNIIACSAGMSRSPTIAAFALAAHLEQQPQAMLETIAENKTLEIKPALWQDVEKIFSQIHR